MPLLAYLKPKNASVSLVALAAVACHRNPPPPAVKAAVASASASATPKEEPPRPRCLGAEPPGLRVTLGAPAPAPAASAEEGDDGIGLPFSPEVGGAAPFETGFAVGVLEPSKEGTNAALWLLSADRPAKKIDLGKVHGDVLAPRIVARPDGVLAVVPDGAPNGSILRFAKIDDPAGGARVTWGADLPQGNDESDAFSVELGEKALAVAWDEWDSRDAHSVVKVATFATGDVAKAPPSVVVSAAHEDAEAPALVPRAGGFWIAWITNVKREPDKKERGETSEAAE